MEASAVDALAVPAVTFIPVGVVGHPNRVARPASAIHDTPAPGMAISTASRAVSRRPRTAVPRRDRDERRGIIEINMAGGTTLRVDTTVDDEALRRVLTVLRSLSCPVCLRHPGLPGVPSCQHALWVRWSRGPGGTDPGGRSLLGPCLHLPRQTSRLPEDPLL